MTQAGNVEVNGEEIAVVIPGEQNTTAGNPQITMTPGNTRDIPRVTINVDNGGPGGSHPSQALCIDVRDGICFIPNDVQKSFITFYIFV